MDSWQLLNSELDAWAADGKVADFWWRDDDAASSGAKLDELLSVTETTGLLLAVIPAKADQSLAASLQAAPHVIVAQHGYAHINHAPRGQGLGAWELGLHRGERAVLEELDHGRQLLEALFADTFIPVIVPPWNHIDSALMAPVADKGFCGVSCFGPRQDRQLSPGFTVVNSHCDPIRWKEGADFKGDSKTVNQLVDHLKARRTGLVDTTEPSGFLTHHLVMEEDSWNFCRQLVDNINSHPAAHWCKDVSVLFGSDS